MVPVEARRRRLAVRHRLAPHRRTDDVVQIADDLVVLHSSDPTSVFLSVAARMENPSVEAIETALYEDRTLLRHHGMRRTLWVGSPEIIGAVNASSTRKIATNERRLLLKYLDQTDGIDDPEATLDAGLTSLLDVVAAEGPIGTREIGRLRPDLTTKLVAGSGKYTIEVGLHTRLTLQAALEARLIRARPNGSWNTSEYAWDLFDRWTGGQVPTDPEEIGVREAAATLLGRWLARFGPATEADMKWWTGWTLTMVRHALADIGAVSIGGEEESCLLPDDGIEEHADPVDDWIALLPGLDPTTMGWKDRAWFLDGNVAERVFDRNGNAGPTIWCNGSVIGGWAQREDGSLALDVLRRPSRNQRELLEIEVDRLTSFIADVRFRVRFPSPNQAELLG